jgi:hypothetical protein
MSLPPLPKKQKKKEKKEELCLQFPLALPYVSLHFSSQVCFKVSTKANRSYDERFTLGFTKDALFISKTFAPYAICLVHVLAHTKGAI